MPVDSSDQVNWERVNAELRAAKEAQQRAWGDVDDAVLGRYLADEASSIEQASVEAALQNHADLRFLTDLVRDVLTESPNATPVAPPAPVATPSAPILAFRSPKQPRRMFARPRMAILAAACLFLALGLTLFRSDNSAVDAHLASVTTLGGAVATNTRPGSTNGFTGLRDSDVITFFERIEKEIKEIDDDVKDSKSDDDRATNVANRVFHVAAKNNLDAHPKFGPRMAENLNRIGQICYKQQNLDQAGVCYEKALEIQRKTLGDDAPATQQTCKFLAAPISDAEPAFVPDEKSAYFLKGDARMMLHAPTAPPVQPKRAEPGKNDKAQDSAVALRERFNKPEGQKKVKETVVPGLINALQHASTSHDRMLAAYALGNLGPAARDAAPTIVSCLSKAQTPQERFALVRALNHMGPTTTKDVVPVLVHTWQCCEDKQVRDAVAATLSLVPDGKAALSQVTATPSPIADPPAPVRDR